MITAIFLAGATLLPGYASTWTDGTSIWSGNPFCAETKFIPQAGSPFVDAGTIRPGLDCPTPGLGKDCREWYGNAPDVGPCEFVPPSSATVPTTPSNPTIRN